MPKKTKRKYSRKPKTIVEIPADNNQQPHPLPMPTIAQPVTPDVFNQEAAVISLTNQSALAFTHWAKAMNELAEVINMYTQKRLTEGS